MKIIYTKHAEQRLLLRNIPKTKVDLTILDPDYKEKGKGETSIYWRHFGQGYLKVIIIEYQDKLIIITLYWVSSKKIKFKKVIKM